MKRSIVVLKMLTVAFLMLTAWPALADGQSFPRHLRPVPPENAATAIAASPADPSSRWTPLNNQPGAHVGTMLQLRDGRILVFVDGTSQWLILTPDANGSYVNGTWSSGGNLPSDYAPLYFASQVLLNGREVLVEGGEFNLNSQDSALGAIGKVTPFGDITWTPNAPPDGWTAIGDSSSITLADGRVMLIGGPVFPVASAIFDGPNSWITTAPELNYADETGLTLLPNNKVLTVETWPNSPCAPSDGGTELYTVTNHVTGVGEWACGPLTPVPLDGGDEIGAAIMMYNGKVIQFGGGTPATAIYDVARDTWSAGPTPPDGFDQPDGPAALEPNGKVLTMLNPGFDGSGCQFFEYDPISNTLPSVENPAGCPGAPSFFGHLMILPTGQIMFAYFNDFVEVYNPAPCAEPERCWSGAVLGAAPLILLVSPRLKSGSTDNFLFGFQLNGLSQNNAYGDDYQADTDYPLVRLKSVADDTVHYAFTHDDCRPQTPDCHSIAPFAFGHTWFDLPALTPGLYDLVAVANGIASESIRVQVHE